MGSQFGPIGTQLGHNPATRANRANFSQLFTNAPQCRVQSHPQRLKIQSFEGFRQKPHGCLTGDSPAVSEPH